MTNQEKLVLLAGQSERKAELVARRATLIEQKQSASLYAESRKTVWQKETADVDKLEGKSLPNLLYIVTRQMAKKRISETAEADAARAEYETARAHLDELSSELADIETELRRLGNCDKDFEALLSEMTDQALRRGGALGDAVSEITDRIRRNTDEAARLLDLRLIGERLLDKSQEIGEVLQYARDYSRHISNTGTRSGPMGRAVLRNMAISETLDKGRDQVSVLVALAQCFQSDLIDLPSIGQMQITQNTFKGAHGESSETRLELAIAEMDEVCRTVLRSLEKIKRIQPLRADAADRAKRELIETLAQIQR